MRLLLLGASGQAGTSLRRLAAEKNLLAIDSPPHAALDVRDTSRLARQIGDARPDWVVNFSAFHVLEDCEDDFARAMLVNAVAVRAMAVASRAAGAGFLTVSTDYVFDGQRSEPWREDDEARPLQAYGASKRAGELAALAAAPEHTFIVRTCGLYGHNGSRERGGNFIEKRLAEAGSREQLEIGSDIVCTPTSADAFADAILHFLTTPQPSPGIYHFTAEGACSWAEFTAEAFAQLGTHCRIVPVDRKGEYGRVRRPAYSVLANTRGRALGIMLPHWKEDLARYLRDRPRFGMFQDEGAI
jgi:dTDP-4-dehydrorhamnose reductase